MEGSRHEKVIITIAAYVIGFVTAYIAFGLSGDQSTKTIVIHDQKPVTEEPASTILINKSGLFYNSNGKMQILSANSASLPNALSMKEPTDGFHYEVTEVLLSDDGKYVYFCEQKLPTTPECHPFVYDTEENIIHVVYMPDGNRFIALEDYSASWLEDGRLQVGDFISNSSTQPWK